MNQLFSRVLVIPRLLSDLLLGAIQNFPGPVGFKLRYWYWKIYLKYLGKGTRIDVGIYFQNPEFISIADNCWIDRGVIILAGIDKSERQKKVIRSKLVALQGEVVIGRNAHIGPYSILSGIDSGIFIGNDCTLSSGAKFYAFSHHFRFHDNPENSLCSFGSMVDQTRQSMICGPIVLEDNVGVALNTIILPGVHVGRNSFIKTNSVLYNQNFTENSLISGDPAKRQGFRFQITENLEGNG